MLEHFAYPGSATGFKILAAVAIVMLIYGLAGLADNLQWCIETRREHKAKGLIIQPRKGLFNTCCPVSHVH
jgi:hypothetical protein